MLFDGLVTVLWNASQSHPTRVTELKVSARDTVFYFQYYFLNLTERT